MAAPVTIQSKDQREIINGLNELRLQQRQIMNKITQLEQDSHEHGMVISTLSEVESKRRCFRMIGDVLVERTVGEVLPVLEQNKSQMTTLLKTLNEQLEVKAKELQEYTHKHNIKFHTGGPEGLSQLANAESDDKNTKDSEPGQQSGVLVAPS